MPSPSLPRTAIAARHSPAESGPPRLSIASGRCLPCRPNHLARAGGRHPPPDRRTATIAWRSSPPRRGRVRGERSCSCRPARQRRARPRRPGRSPRVASRSSRSVRGRASVLDVPKARRLTSQKRVRRLPKRVARSLVASGVALMGAPLRTCRGDHRRGQWPRARLDDEPPEWPCHPEEEEAHHEDHHRREPRRTREARARARPPRAEAGRSPALALAAHRPVFRGVLP